MRVLAQSLKWVFLVVIMLIWLLPTYMVLVTASTSATAYTGTATWWPTKFGLFDNIVVGLTEGQFVQPILNSFLYALVSASLAVLLGMLAAFAVVITPVKNPKLWFWAIYAGTLLPLQVFAVPLFNASVATNLYDTKWILFIVYIALCIPFAFFVQRNFLVTLPPEIAQAAKLDGANWFRMFTAIYLPLLRPAMVAAFVFQFMFVWGELFFALTLTRSPENWPVMAALNSLQGTQSALAVPVVLATAIVVSIPTLLLFLAAQRAFARGLSGSV